VGHSMGGTTIARATERYPHKIHVAVYVSGSMYTSGMSGTEINGEVYNLNFFWHYYFLTPPFVIKFYGMT
jgi:pimeloyl-ACP methyl ester carboxylesterase